MHELNSKKIHLQTPATEILICKLLILLEHTDGQVPGDKILSFISVTFRTIVEAFRERDLARMRHIAEFFSEIKKQGDHRDIWTRFNYQSELSRIIEVSYFFILFLYSICAYQSGNLENLWD